MGFGILFLGYVLAFAFTLSSSYFFSDVLGGLLMAYAFSKLSQFNRKFKYPTICAAVYSALAISRAVATFVSSSVSDGILHVISALIAGSIIALHFTMFAAMIAITSDLGLSKIAMKARRNFIVMILYFTLYTLTLLSKNRLEATAPEFTSYLYLFIQLFEIVWLIMNLVLIGSCLKRIGVEDEDAPDLAPSSFKKLNNMLNEKEAQIFSHKGRTKADKADRKGKK